METLFVICGNDERNLHLAQSLRKKGYRVALWRTQQQEGDGMDVITDLELLDKQCVAVLSPAAAQDKIDMILHFIKPGCTVFGGYINAQNKQYAEDHGIRYINILDFEPMSILNAIPTAEGALCLSIQNTAYTINGAHVLILGYGRLGKATARLFHAMGANVEVFSRLYEERAMAVLSGIHALPLDFLPSSLLSANIIINTIPARILGNKELKLLPADSLVIDLASAPGGVDHEEARRLGVFTLHALSLPAKYAPKSAAQYMETGILSLLHETGVT